MHGDVIRKKAKIVSVCGNGKSENIFKGEKLIPRILTALNTETKTKKAC
jgi:hypothetical protein